MIATVIVTILKDMGDTQHSQRGAQVKHGGRSERSFASFPVAQQKSDHEFQMRS